MVGRALAPALCLALLPAAGAGGEDRLPGPVPAELVRVVDGDTVDVRARIWLGQTVETRVRLAGIDAPERRGRCAAEREMAERAADLLARSLSAGAIALRDVEYGSFAGRVVARIEAAGTNPSETLLAAGLARPYSGRGPRPDWCGAPPG
jgi:endonuclease YncB( thermonuclease family)